MGHGLNSICDRIYSNMMHFDMEYMYNLKNDKLDWLSGYGVGGRGQADEQWALPKA